MRFSFRSVSVKLSSNQRICLVHSFEDSPSMIRVATTFGFGVSSALRNCNVRRVIFALSTVFLLTGISAVGQGEFTYRKQPESAMVVLAGHHPQWAEAGNDQGAIAADTRLDHLTLVLSRSPEKEKALTDLLASQQDRSSANYHHWLTPAEMGARFGLSNEEMEPVIDWLKSEGLQVNWISPSRVFVDFSGTAVQIGTAFHTELHRYSVRGTERVSVSSDPLVPIKLAVAIKAVRGLYTIDEKPISSGRSSSQVSPELTLSNGDHFLTPWDFATIYDVPTTLTGTGQVIAIVGRSRVDTADLDNFRNLTDTSFADPTVIIPTALGGVDPGPPYTSPPGTGVSLGDQLEATLDVMRAGGTAPAAQVLLVVATSASGGIGVATQYLVQTTPVPANVINISFGACESNAGVAGVNFWDQLFQQAASEGISVFVSSGDSGASGCDDEFAPPPASPQANSPNSICSSSYATCVGGTEFNDAADPSQYWGTNNPNLSSALGYIPEGAWNEPLDSNVSPQVAASGGGVSSFIPTPSWQTGTGVPSARTGRYTPDLAFSASGHDGYFACFAAAGASCVANTQGEYEFEYFFGTSAAAPSLAAITALLNEYIGEAQGNLNPALYATAASSPSSFQDVTLASSGVSNCQLSTPSMCNNSAPGPNGLTGGQAGYLVNTGYDEVTGLGSLDVASFLDNYDYAGPKFTPTVTIDLNSASITSAQQLTVSVQLAGPGEKLPTGSVEVSAGTFVTGEMPLSSGTYSVLIPADTLPSGNDTIAANYTPDSAGATQFNPASGSTSVTVTTVGKISPQLQVLLSATSITTEEPVDVQVSVDGGESGGVANQPPTGTVTLTSGTYSSTSSAYAAQFAIPADVLPVGQDTLTATYTPDATSAPIYKGASGSTSILVTTAPLIAPVLGITVSDTTITTADALTVRVSPESGAALQSPTGTITITSGAYTAGPVTIGIQGANFTIPAGVLPVGTDTITANYTPDSASSTIFLPSSGSVAITVSAPVPPNFTVGGTAVTLAPGATSGNTSIITVTPSGGFTGSITLTAAITSSPSGAQDPPTLSFGASSPVSITNGAGTATLTVSTSAPTTAVLSYPAGRTGGWYATGGAMLACLVLWGVPARNRGWKRVIFAIAVLMAVVATGIMACGGGGSTGNPGIPGTTAGNYVVTVTATSGSIMQTTSINVVVQ
jgi:pseudomonalisin